MKRKFIAVTIEENQKYYAYLVPVSDCDNLISKLNIKGIKCANIFSTKKEASNVVEMWNESYKTNGTYLFDEIQF